MGKYANIICSLILSASFLGRCYLLAKAEGGKNNISSDEAKISDSKTILTEAELSEYLGITNSDLKNLLDSDRKKRDEFHGGVYDRYSFLPSMELPGGHRVFLKSEIENWVQYHSLKVSIPEE
ncbi:hypothetical protein [Paenibacillus macerans]|uniref:hypothetical protein n=1 Tax=Paenibacillus macerans TaxID=44252 RepID=UPI0020426AFC|nr:hypothetical protein [Paenibacillus macerans]MCM3701909.1 hypothetical protein [Paenibacillus macerans]